MGTNAKDESTSLPKPTEYAATLVEAASADELIGFFQADTDSDFTVLSGNPLFFHMLGYTNQADMNAAVGCRLRDCVSRDCQARLDVLLRTDASLYLETVSLNLCVLRKDGQRRWIYFQLRNQCTDGEFCLCGCAVDVTERRAADEALRIRGEEYKIIAAQSGKLLQRYEIATSTAVWLFESEAAFGLPPLMNGFPECLPNSGLIDPGSVSTLLAFYQDIRNGISSGGCNLRLMGADGALHWFHADSTLIFDNEGNPLYAVVAFFDNTIQREKDLAYATWKNTVSARVAESLTYWEVNLSRNQVDREDGQSDLVLWDRANRTFSDFVAYGAKHFVYPADEEAYWSFFDASRLLSLFEKGVFADQLEYRIQLTSPEPSWIRAEIQMVRDPHSDDVHAFLAFVDIDPEKRELEKLSARANRDPLTGILNRKAMTEHIIRIIQNSRDTDSHALFIIDLDKFKQVNDQFGHQVGDAVLESTAKTITGVFRPGDLVGRLGGDEFLAFLSGPFSLYAIQSKAAALCAALERPADESLPRVSASVGAAIFSGPSADFDQLYRAADMALYRAKRAGQNQYRLFREAMDQEDALFLSPASSNDPPDPQCGLWTAVQPNFQPDFRCFLEELLAGKPTDTLCLPLRQPDGSYQWVELSYRNLSETGPASQEP